MESTTPNISDTSLPEPYQRPHNLPSITCKISVGCGPIYITISYDQGSPREIFFFFSKFKSGSCVGSLLEIIGRFASNLLQQDMPLLEIARIMQGFRCPQHESCIDIISKAFQHEFPPIHKS